jgi:hypothetical protein
MNWPCRGLLFGLDLARTSRCYRSRSTERRSRRDSNGGSMTGNSPVFDGTLPLVPYDPQAQDFCGAVSGASGTPPSVLAIVIEADGTLIYLNTVGYQTACSAHFAHLWQHKLLSFQPAPHAVWDGPAQLIRAKDWSYQEIGGAIKDTPFVNAMGLLRLANIGHGMKVPPSLPTEEREAAPGAASTQDDDEQPSTPPAQVNLTGAPPRFIFGNLHETTPAAQAFHGHLRALRVVRLSDNRSAEHHRCSQTWLEQLWLYGLEQHLIVPLLSLGIRAWRLSGDLIAWADLIRIGLSDGWLPRPD